MSSSRNTMQRQLVLNAVHTLRHHPTADDIYRHVAAQHPAISKGTVYRNLGQLAQDGAIQRVTHLNAADRFDFELVPHYHFRCTVCDGVFDVALPYNDALLREVPNPDGFEFTGCEVVFTGRCPGCKQSHGGE